MLQVFFYFSLPPHINHYFIFFLINLMILKKRKYAPESDIPYKIRYYRKVSLVSPQQTQQHEICTEIINFHDDFMETMKFDFDSLREEIRQERVKNFYEGPTLRKSKKQREKFFNWLRQQETEQSEENYDLDEIIEMLKEQTIDHSL